MIKKSSLYGLLFLALAFVSFAYTPPTTPDVNFNLTSGYIVPENPNVNFNLTSVEGPVNNPPTYNETLPDFVRFHNEPTFTATLNWSDPDGDNVSATSSNENMSAVVNNETKTVALSWNTVVTDFGNNSFTITIDDGNGGTAEDTFFIYVNDTAPTFNETIQSHELNVSQSINVVYNWSDAENDPVIATSNCSFLSVVVNNVSNTVTLSYTGNAAQNGTNNCKLNLDDRALNTDSNNFTINVTIPDITITLGENFSSFIPTINVSQATIDPTLNLYNESNVSFENMTEPNGLWSANNTGLISGDLFVTQNESESDVFVGCSCTFDYLTRVNLSGTNATNICTLGAGLDTQIWCWVDFVNLNFTTKRNISFEMTAGLS